MLKPGWFNEYSPDLQKKYDNILKIIENNFQRFNYAHIQTPAVEKNSTLTAKWWDEISKQIFGLYWLAQWKNDLKKYSLRFDHTIPFARFVIDNFDKLVFPFKKYQIWKIRRWERQQKWRYKEFMQADIDVIWENKKYDNVYYYDSEVIVVLYKCLDEINAELWTNLNFVININNKKIIQDFVKDISTNKEGQQKILTLIDKKDKLSYTQFQAELDQIWIKEKDQEKLQKFLSWQASIENLDEFLELSDSKNYRKWIEELKQTVSNIESIAKAIWLNINYKINFGIVRWLDYYTWLVFEIQILDNPDLWSVCGWWRYDNLTTFLNKKFNCSWVWGSIWVDRIFGWLLEKGLLDKKPVENELDYFFLNFEETYQDILNLMGQFLKEWYNVEMFPFEDKLKNQLNTANKKSAKNVIILWPNEKTKGYYIKKDMSTWQEQKMNITFK